MGRNWAKGLGIDGQNVGEYHGLRIYGPALNRSFYTSLRNYTEEALVSGHEDGAEPICVHKDLANPRRAF